MNEAALKALIEKLAAMGLDKAVEELKTLDPKNPTERLLLAAAVDAIDKYGLTGFSFVESAILEAIAGGGPVELDLTDLAVASDLLAALESKEEGAHKAVTAALAKVGAVLAEVVKGLAAGLLS